MSDEEELRRKLNGKATGNEEKPNISVSKMVKIPVSQTRDCGSILRQKNISKYTQASMKSKRQV